jgi:hypothetical protein
MDRRKPLLVNPDEFRTDKALRDAAAEAGYGVHVKVRVADARGHSFAGYRLSIRTFMWVSGSGYRITSATCASSSRSISVTSGSRCPTSSIERLRPIG